MFHVEHSLAFLLLGGSLLLTGQLLQAQEGLYSASPSFPAATAAGQKGAEVRSLKEPSEGQSFLVLPTASSDEELKLHLALGWQDLLLGWEESAERHFNKSLERDSHCVLARAGLMMLASSSHAEEHLQALQEQWEQENSPSLTPAEASYLSIFLKAAGRHLGEAGREMSHYADRYRADLFAALWSLQLLHCADIPYTPEGKESALQREALQRAQELFSARPHHPLVCYLRAYLEETAPIVSLEALEAAQRCAELMPWHPMPELLWGHLLYRSGREKVAIEHFRRAAQRAQELFPANEESRSALVLTAQLYEATALWSTGKDRESLQLRRKLCALPLPPQNERTSQPATLLRWEIRTLPLRILVLRKQVPTQGEIDAAYRAATPTPDEASAQDDLVLEERNCLRAALSARRKARLGDMKEALRSLQLAEEALARFEKTLPRARDISAGWVTPWYRAQEACLIAVYAAKTDVYPSSADIWNENLQRAIHAPILLMPPAIPQRSASAGETARQTNSSKGSSPSSLPSSSTKKSTSTGKTSGKNTSRKAGSPRRKQQRRR